MTKLFRCQKIGLNCFEQPAYLNRVQMSGKSAQSTTIQILSLESIYLDVDELSYDKVLPNLLPVRLKTYKYSHI